MITMIVLPLAIQCLSPISSLWCWLSLSIGSRITWPFSFSPCKSFNLFYNNPFMNKKDLIQAHKGFLKMLLKISNSMVGLILSWSFDHGGRQKRQEGGRQVREETGEAEMFSSLSLSHCVYLSLSLSLCGCAHVCLSYMLIKTTAFPCPYSAFGKGTNFRYTDKENRVKNYQILLC